MLILILIREVARVGNANVNVNVNGDETSLYLHVFTR